MKLNKLTLFALFFLLSFGSCVNEGNVDFTQVDGLNFSQQLSGSLISLTTSLSDLGDQNNLPFNGFNFDKNINVFDSQTIQNELVSVNLHFEFNNAFNRDFKFTFNFLDATNTIVFSTIVNINKRATTIQDVLVEGLDVIEIKKATKVAINIAVINSTPSNTIDNVPGTLVSFTMGATLDLGTSQINASLISLEASLPDFAELDNFPFVPFEFHSPLDIFTVAEIRSRLTKAEFHFEIENTFNRDFEVVFEFLDRNHIVTYSIPPITLNKVSKNIDDAIVEGVDLENLIHSSQVRVRVNVLNSTTIDNTPGAFINFKSSVTFTF
ncbi:MAG: hypothetical protein L3J45_01810 [Flavobacteriaceae bacterium]|nr:hypothetical protein [Flavobacteriaceae bacterium]